MKKIILTILGLVTIIALAGIYKFDYLSSQDGYNVDGNKISEIKKNNQDKNNERADKIELEENMLEENMSVKIPKWEFSEEKGDFVVTFKKYEVPKNKAVLYEIFRKMFEINGDANQFWNGLEFEKVNLINGKADIYLVGKWYPVGDMSGAYMKHEIEAAAFQFPNVKRIEVFINGKTFDWCIDDESDGEGGCNVAPQFWRTEKI